jgi:hypothetical protein
MWIRKGGCDSQKQAVQPLTYVHPVSKRPTMCLHISKMDTLVMDYKTPSEHVLNNAGKTWVLGEIYEAINAHDQSMMYTHEVKQPLRDPKEQIIFSVARG